MMGAIRTFSDPFGNVTVLRYRPIYPWNSIKVIEEHIHECRRVLKEHEDALGVDSSDVESLTW